VDPAALDPAASDPAAFGHGISAAWTALKFRPVAFTLGCGCGGGFGTLTVRDFEEALVFHIHERWRPDPAQGAQAAQAAQADQATQDPAFAALAALERLDDIIAWAGGPGDAPAAAGRLELLRDIKRSLDAFATTCAAHRFRADAV